MPRPPSADPASARSFWLPDSLMDRLSAIAEERGITRSMLVRQTLEALPAPQDP